MYHLKYRVQKSEREQFKALCKSVNLKYRFDYKAKLWEAYGKKPSKKNVKVISDKFLLVEEYQDNESGYYEPKKVGFYY